MRGLGFSRVEGREKRRGGEERGDRALRIPPGMVVHTCNPGYWGS